MCKSAYMELSDGQSELFLQVSLVHIFYQKKGISQAYQNNSFHHNTNFS